LDVGKLAFDRHEKLKVKNFYLLEDSGLSASEHIRENVSDI
jgi:hypothetical protein